MARDGNLDARTISAAKPRQSAYRLSDGRGLLLMVKPSGAKCWVFRGTINGKRVDRGIGSFPDTSLQEAREAAKAARKLAREGVDPAAERAERLRQQHERDVAAAERASRTFRFVAAECIRVEEPSWKNKRTASLWESSLERWVYPAIGDKPIDEIARNDVKRAVDDVWLKRPATARKVLRRIGAVLRYGAANGWRSSDNPADYKVLRAGKLLPDLPGGHKQPALPWPRLPAFLRALSERDGLAPLALRLLVLTALRSNEIRSARWSWISFEGTPTLTVPAHFMKRKKKDKQVAHRVPLSPAAVDTLVASYTAAHGLPATRETISSRARLAGDTLIFPSATRTTPLSDMALSAVIKRMNGPERPDNVPAPWRDNDGRDAVPHGFRATFSTWVDDTLPHERETAERALAHEVGNEVSAAYRRSDAFGRRVDLMAAWASHCVSEPANTAAARSAGT